MKGKKPDIEKGPKLEGLLTTIKRGLKIERKAPVKRGRGKKISQEQRNATVFRQRLILGILAAIVLLWVVRCLHYVRHFQKNTVINGVNVSGLSLKEAKLKLAEEVPLGYNLTITGPGGKQEIIRGSQLALQVTDAKNAKQVMRRQNALTWLSGNGDEKEYEIDLTVSYNEEALASAIGSLSMLNTETMIAPVNSALIENDKGYYEITKEVVGTTLRVDEVRQAIVNAVSSGRNCLDTALYQDLPEITSENGNLVKRRDEWNAFLRSDGMTYKVCEATEVFDGNKIARLLTDDGTTVTIDRQKICDLVAEWAFSYNTYNHQFDFTTYYGTVVTVDPYGNYGYEINDENLVDELYDHISKGDNGTYEVSYYHKPPYNFNNGLGGNYVEINIDKQRLWVWKDGEVILETPIVSGLPVYGRTTYYGCYAINLMQEHAVLGDVNVEGYESEVRYWVRFNSGEGIHDADWRDSFGGRIWLYSGSHGCVNVPVDNMPDIYANVEMGEAVVVYGHDYDPAVWDPSTTEVNTAYYESYYESLEKAE